MNVAATASVCGIPAAVNPPMRPASTTPMPPGTGAMPPSSDASELITMSWSSGSESPYACSAAPSTSAKSTCVTRLPPNSIAALRGVVRIPLRFSFAAPSCGATTPFKPAAQLRHHERDGDARSRRRRSAR